MKDDHAPSFSDEHLALRFAEQYAGNLRYVSEIGRWYCWDGKCWQRDRKLLGFNSARIICRAAARECNEAQYRVRGLASAKTVAAVEKLWLAEPYPSARRSQSSAVRAPEVGEHDALEGARPC